MQRRNLSDNLVAVVRPVHVIEAEILAKELLLNQHSGRMDREDLEDLRTEIGELHEELRESIAEEVATGIAYDELVDVYSDIGHIPSQEEVERMKNFLAGDDELGGVLDEGDEEEPSLYDLGYDDGYNALPQHELDKGSCYDPDEVRDAAGVAIG